MLFIENPLEACNTMAIYGCVIGQAAHLVTSSDKYFRSCSTGEQPTRFVCAVQSLLRKAVREHPKETVCEGQDHPQRVLKLQGLLETLEVQ